MGYSAIAARPPNRRPSPDSPAGRRAPSRPCRSDPARRLFRATTGPRRLGSTLSGPGGPSGGISPAAAGPAQAHPSHIRMVRSRKSRSGATVSLCERLVRGAAGPSRWCTAAAAAAALECRTIGGSSASAPATARQSGSGDSAVADSYRICKLLG